MLMMLRTRVITNNVRPTAKSVLYDVEPTGFSPPAVVAMKPVMVCMSSRGSRLRFLQ